jgi:hypothetical protein
VIETLLRGREVPDSADEESLSGEAAGDLGRDRRFADSGVSGQPDVAILMCVLESLEIGEQLAPADESGRQPHLLREVLIGILQVGIGRPQVDVDGFADA